MSKPHTPVASNGVQGNMLSCLSVIAVTGYSLKRNAVLSDLCYIENLKRNHLHEMNYQYAKV